MGSTVSTTSLPSWLLTSLWPHLQASCSREHRKSALARFGWFSGWQVVATKSSASSSTARSATAAEDTRGWGLLDLTSGCVPSNPRKVGVDLNFDAAEAVAMPIDSDARPKRRHHQSSQLATRRQSCCSHTTWRSTLSASTFVLPWFPC